MKSYVLEILKLYVMDLSHSNLIERDNNVSISTSIYP